VTEIAHDAASPPNYHINETPMMSRTTSSISTRTVTYLTPDDWTKVDDLLDYLDDKRHNEGTRWSTRASTAGDEAAHAGAVHRGNAAPARTRLIIRTDGTLATVLSDVTRHA